MVYDDVKDAAIDAYDSSKKAIKENIGDYSSAISDVETYVSKNPVKSILICLGVFVVASRMIKN